ncbi:hypothetical protein AURDEDRAFT_165624 [Auricularia subglabra TFB-10046 SS5]|nr:hypothetical protein AURDEDRAFT_165624 [Auricularia subglabra TFB-10046 SS5]
MGRCHSLVISTDDILEEDDALAPILTAATPCLRHLHLLIPRESDIEPLEIFPDAPKVVRLRTTCPALFSKASFPSLEYGALCSPRTTDLDNDVGAMLRTCPTIETLSLHNAHFDDVQWEQQVAATVRVLRISQKDNPGSLDALVNVFSFPGLRWVQLYGKPKTSGSLVGLLAELPYAAPLVSGVVIENVETRHFARLVDAVGGLRKLSSLTIKSCTIDRIGLEYLCDGMSQPREPDGTKRLWFCGLLARLKIRGCTLAPGCAQHKIVEMVDRHLRASQEAHNPSGPVRLRMLLLPLGVNAEIKASVRELLAS